MGYEDDIKSDQIDERDYPRSFPRTEAENDLEMRNFGEAHPNNGGNGTADRRDGDGLRQRNNTDFEARKREEKEREIEKRRNRKEVPVAVVEQRVSNLAQGALCKSLPPPSLHDAPRGTVLAQAMVLAE